MPVTGIIPVVIPTFTRTWKASIEVIPTAKSLPKISLASFAICFMSPAKLSCPILCPPYRYCVAASAAAVIASFIFPVAMDLVPNPEAASAPGGIFEVLRNLVLSVVDNPVNALLKANYIGILAWAIGLGWAMRKAGETTRQVFKIGRAHV